MPHDLDYSCKTLGRDWDFPGRFNKTFRRRKPTKKQYVVPDDFDDKHNTTKQKDHSFNFGGKTRRRR